MDADDDGDGNPDITDPDDDGDGIADSDEDPDHDGIGNGLDEDDDGDGIPDVSDTTPNEPDSDHDGIDNDDDPDDDNDAIADGEDPDGDTDGDGVDNGHDDDDDGDGIDDGHDGDDDNDLVDDPNEDPDGDGVGNGQDDDDDGDGIPDVQDPSPGDPDSDHDGINDDDDGDDDNDGVPDPEDPDDDGDGNPDGGSPPACDPHLILVSVMLGGDELLNRWPTGERFDNPDMSKPVWLGQPILPVCYLRNRPPRVGFRMAATHTGGCASARVREPSAGAVIGEATVPINALVVTGTIYGQHPLPGSDGVTYGFWTLDFDFSTDGGDNWHWFGSASPTVWYFVESTPLETAYDFGLAKACGYVGGNSDIPGSITGGVAGDLQYNPTLYRFPAAHPLVYYYGNATYQCTHHARLMSCLLNSVGVPNLETYVWAGAPDLRRNYTRASNGHGANFRAPLPWNDYAEANPHYEFHAVVRTGTAPRDPFPNYYDPSYGTEGLLWFDETEPAPGGGLLPQQTGLGLPGA